MPTVAPGWPNPYSSHEMSTDTVVRSNLAADGSEPQKQQKTTGKVTTEIGKSHNINNIVALSPVGAPIFIFV